VGEVLGVTEFALFAFLWLLVRYRLKQPAQPKRRRQRLRFSPICPSAQLAVPLYRPSLWPCPVPPFAGLQAKPLV